MDSITGGVGTISDGVRSVGYIHRAELRSKGEDRTAVLHFERGIIIAIFDGHCGNQLSDFAAQKLPALLSERLRPDNVDVEAIMKETIEEFYRSLLLPLLALFDEGEDWSDPKWLNTETEVYPRIGYLDKDDERYAAGTRATVGSTALIAFLDKQRKHLWVASLGDCDAVCGRHKDDKWTSLFLSERHNCDNPAEVERLCREHSNEDHLLKDDTPRYYPSLGDHQLKAPLYLATRLLSNFCRPRLEPQEILDFNSWTPPYMSSTPSIRRHDVLPGDMFVFASDGLRDQIRDPDAQQFDIVFSLANGEHDDDLEAWLGHECVLAQVGDNVAERVIGNILFGTDAKRARELNKKTQRDDISVVVLALQ